MYVYARTSIPKFRHAAILLRKLRENVRVRAHEHPEVSEEGSQHADRVGPVVIERQSALALDEPRHRQKRFEMLLHGNRARTRSAAAMRSGKRLVQVEVNNVGAHMARFRDTQKRVHIGAVEVEQRAMLVQHLGNRLDFRLEDSHRIGIRDHQGGDIAVYEPADLISLQVATLMRVRDHDLESRERAARGIGPMRSVGDYHLVTNTAVALQPRTRDEQSRKLALRAGRRMERYRVHPGNLGERRLHPSHQFERTLCEMRRGTRMERRETGHRRHLVVEHRVVLHRARAERVELQRLPEVKLRQSEKMTQRLRLAQFGKSLDILAAYLCAEDFKRAPFARCAFAEVDAAPSRR